jgi:hypothetical protein
MVISWENIDNYRITKGRTGYTIFRRIDGKCKQDSFILIESCIICGDPYFIKKQHMKSINTCSNHCSNMGIGNPVWKGGITKSNIPSFDTYNNQISLYEKTRRSHNNREILEVVCHHCKCWFVPKTTDVRRRIQSITNISKGGQNLYCSDECKNNCSIYGQKKHPRDFNININNSREVQPQLRKLVLERDNWTCKKCGDSYTQLHCHHYEGVELNPIESADVDNCITLCKKCHNAVHKHCDMRRNKC